MGKLNNLVGKRFGKLTVTKKDSPKGRLTYWICECDCGTIKSIRANHLTSGKIVSCGCHKILASSWAKLKRNKIEIINDYAVVYMPNGFSTKIDIDSIDKVENHFWNVNHYGYATTHIDTTHRQLLHRLIMGVNNPKCVVDHINHNKLDNRKCNLRIFESNMQNIHNMTVKSNNSTGIRNIYHTGGKYFAHYTRFGIKHTSPYFSTLSEAKKWLYESIVQNNYIYGDLDVLHISEN